jgi:hypothetical protein
LRQEPYKTRDFKIAMGRKGVYKCAQNFFKHNMTWLATSNVPRRQSAIDSLRDYHFTTCPVAFPSDIVCCLPAGCDPPETEADITRVQRISPDELEFAFIDKLYDLVCTENITAEELQPWKSVALACTYEYRVIDSEDSKHWQALQMRQTLTEHSQTMKFTTLQLMYDVVWDKQRRERIHGPMTETQVADAYLANITFADGAEKVSIAFVGCACTMNDRVLNIPKVREILLLSDQACNNIFDGWTKLQTVIGKARTPDNILWAFLGLYDAYKMGFILDLGLRLLQGTGPGMNGRGIVDLLIYKKGLLQHLLGQNLEAFTFKFVIKAKIRHVLKDFETVRANCTGWPGNNPDISWQGGWPKAAQDYLVFVEGLVYNQTHDTEVMGITNPTPNPNRS